MSTNKLNLFLKSGVAMLPLAVAFHQMPAHAQPKTQAQLEAEAAKAREEAATGSDADDAAAIADLVSGVTGTSTSAERSRDIVVTGTNIRGVAPTGTNLSVMSREDIQATGQSSVTQLLTTIPGMGSFLSIPQLPGGVTAAATQVNRPNLRSTPDGEGLGTGDPGASTLILIDGNRQSGGGIRQVATDPDSIPVGLLERVEVNTDGASSAYGSDAIGGVINFVTRRKYNGVEVSGKLGYADNYWTGDANIIAGKDWGSGSFYVNGMYARNTGLKNGDRDYYKNIDWNTGLETGLNCDLANIRVSSTAATGTGTNFVPPIPVHYYRTNADGTVTRSGTSAPVGGLDTSVPGAGQPSDSSRPNLCTLGELSTRVAPNTRWNLNASFFQNITDDIDLQIKGNYSRGKSRLLTSPITSSFTVGANNVWRQELIGTTGAQAMYPTIQAGFPTTRSDVIRPCTGASSTITGTNPVPCNGNPVGTPQPVPHVALTNFGEARGLDAFYINNATRKFGGSADLTWRIDGNWLLKVTGTYDRTTTYQDYAINQNGAGSILQYVDGTAGGPCTVATNSFVNAGGYAALNSTTDPRRAAATAAFNAARQVCINPYAPELSNPTILDDAFSYDNRSLAHNALIVAKFNLDGALFEIPGGKIRVALGGEYNRDDWAKWQYTSKVGIRRPQSYKLISEDGNNDAGNTVISGRNVWGVYGEINVPLVSRENELTWIKELRFKVSGRYDHYDRFGGSFSPTFGASFKPTNWLTIKGNWNRSFRAPPILIQTNSMTIDDPRGSQIPYTGANVAVPPLLDGSEVVWVLNGGPAPGLKPQTGRQWSVGFEVRPFRGFTGSLSYGYIDYIGTLGQVSPFTSVNQRGIGQGCTESNSVVILVDRTTSCTAAQIAAGAQPMVALTPAQVQAAKDFYLAIVDNDEYTLAETGTRTVWGILDSRLMNVGNSKIGNLDYRLAYNSRTPWGSVFFNVSGSVKVINKTQTSATALFVPSNALSLTSPGSRHSMTAQAGMTYGPLRSSVTLLHQDGYRVTRSATSPQDRVGDFNIVNATASWDFKGDNVVERGLQLTLGIDNVLNTSPPVRKTSTGGGTANGSTFGRLVRVGFTKKF